MTIVTPQIVSQFITLDPEQAEAYDEVKSWVRQLVHRDPDAFMFLLNAIAGTGDNALPLMKVWAAEATSGTLAPRDFAGVVHERPLGLPCLIIPPVS